MLDAGTWKGERIVSEAWIAESLIARTDIEWLEPDDWDWQLAGYGYQWWIGFYEVDGRAFESWVAWGFGGQWVVAIPEFDLVIAVNSSGYDGSDAALNAGHTLIKKYVR